MRFLWVFISLLVLLCVLDVTYSARNKVEDDEEDDDFADDDDGDDADDSDDDTNIENTENISDDNSSKKKKKPSNNKNRRMFGQRMNGRVRLRGSMRPPIFLLPPPLPSPVFVNQPMKTNPSSGVSVRSFGQPLVSAQAVNPGFSITNVRSAVAHNTLGATPNTFVVTPQVTSFQGTPVPSIPSQVSVIHIPGQNQLQISQAPNQLQPKVIFQTQPQIHVQTQNQPQHQIHIQSQSHHQPQVQTLINTQSSQPKQQQQTQPQLQQIQRPSQSALQNNQIQPQPQSPVIISAPVVGNSLDVVSAPVAPPVPSPYYTSALADDIRCMQQPDTLTALLTAPPGYTASPFFNGRPDIDAQSSSNCQITLSVGSNVYRLDISDFQECGVSSQPEEDGKANGLKTPEDEVITIKCKPQDRTLSANHAVDFHGNLVSSPATSRSSVFLGQERDLQCDLGLFRKAPGSSDYIHRVNAGSAIELGQELKLRAAVKAGDGWNYIRLTDVIVYRVPASFNTKTKVHLLEASKRKHMLNSQNGFEPETTVEYAHLVLTDGCRNSAYKAIAPNHPEVNPTNSLIVDFNFKAFMFQTMTEGEAVRITARVTACVEQEDCSITHCPDGFFSHGRKRRGAVNNTSTFENNSTHFSNTTDFDRNLTVVVLTANNREDEWFQREYLMRRLDKENGCPELLISTVALAVALGITLIVMMSIVIFKFCKNRFANNYPHTTNINTDLWTENRNQEMGKPCANYQDKKYTTNNKNLGTDISSNPKADLPAGNALKRSDSALRSLQTFLAASLLQSFGRNAEENVADHKQKNINNGTSATNLNTFKPRLNKQSYSDELFIAVV
uniref:ZP domain-containing protein n=1 Tax=Strigamia maritima TaxID=126957 RepID=T1IMC9_STRMM